MLYLIYVYQDGIPLPFFEMRALSHQYLHPYLLKEDHNIQRPCHEKKRTKNQRMYSIKNTKKSIQNIIGTKGPISQEKIGAFF